MQDAVALGGNLALGHRFHTPSAEFPRPSRMCQATLRTVLPPVGMRVISSISPHYLHDLIKLSRTLLILSNKIRSTIQHPSEWYLNVPTRLI